MTIDPENPVNLLATRNLPEPIQDRINKETKARNEEIKKETAGLSGRDLLRKAIIGEIPKEEKKPKAKKESAPKQDSEDGEENGHIDASKIAEAAAAAASKAVIESQNAKQQEEERKRAEALEAQKRAEAEKAAKPPEIPERFKDSLDVYEQLAKNDPKKFGDIRNRLIEYDQKEADYIRKWKAENPGETFDANSEDHEPFYNSVEIVVSKKEWERAQEEAKTSKISAQVENKIRSEKQQEETKKALEQSGRQIANAVQTNVATAIVELAKRIDPEIEIKGDNLGEQIKHIVEVMPALDIAAERPLQIHAGTLAAAYGISSGVAQYDKNNPFHVAYANSIKELDELTKSQPEDSPMRQDNDGRTYVSPAQFARLSQQDQARHFTISQQDLVDYLGLKFEREVTDRFEKAAGRKVGSASKPSQAFRSQEPEEDHEEEPQRPQRQLPASMSTRSSVGGGTGPAVGNQGNSLQPKGKGFALFEKRLGLR